MQAQSFQDTVSGLPLPTLTSAIDGVMVSAVDPAHNTSHLVYVSEGMAAMVGYKPANLLGQRPDVLFAEDTPADQMDAVASLVEQGKQAVLPMVVLTADNQPIPVHATFLAVPSISDGWPLYLSMFRRLDRPSVEAVIDLSSTGSPLSQQPAAVSSFDQTELFDALAHPGSLDEVIVHLAERAEDLLGTGKVVMALSYAHHPNSVSFDLVRTGGMKPPLLSALLTTIRQDHEISEAESLPVASLPLDLALEFQNAGFSTIWTTPLLRNKNEVLGTVLVAREDNDPPSAIERQLLAAVARLAVLAMDRSRREADLALKALHDPLTGLPTRELMTDRLSQLIDLGKRSHTETVRSTDHKSVEVNKVLGVIMVDIDRFKGVNDRHGSSVGDAVLLQTAQRLRSVLAVGDTIGRLGSDKFLIVCPGRRDEAAAFDAAEQLRSAILAPVELPDREPVQVTVSVGVVMVHGDDDFDAAEVISNSESAVEAAIEAGRDQVSVFDLELRQKLAARHELEAALRDAIELDELFLVYQPIIEVSTGSMMGAEALIRWDRPGHGVLPPALFIDIAEDSGLIIDMGNWVIKEACRQVADWPDRLAGGRPQISVNLSAAQLSHPSLMPTVIEALEYYEVDPGSVGFEVTESMKVEDLERASEALVALADLGCHLSIDDFGIGYATLDYLRRFSMAHTLKIDRSFVDGLGSNREDTAIVSASITLAESLGLTVVAEGVETVEQLEHLHQLGADYAQGYLLSKPVEIDDAHLLWHRATLIPGEAF